MRYDRRRQAAAVCLASLALLALSACGGSSHSSSTTGVQSTTTTGQTVHKTVTVTMTAPGSATTTATAAARPAGPPTCLSAHLSLALASSEGAAGTAYFTFELTNHGSSACSMIGYPGISVVNSTGAIVQHPATRGADQPAPVKLVTLRPGQSAQFLVNSTDVIPSPGCPTNYTGVAVQVFPPNQRVALRIPFTRVFCDLKVGPVQPA